MGTNRHLHTYERINGSKNRFRCIDPDCTHTSTKELLLGKRAMCVKCQQDCILTKEALRRKRVWCANRNCPNLPGNEHLKEKENQQFETLIDVVTEMIGEEK